MAHSYRLLYQIENDLKEIIFTIFLKNNRMLQENRSLDSMYLHEIIACFGKYNILKHLFTSEERQHLYDLVEIRNKICHMKLISYHEKNRLQDCFTFVRNKKINCTWNGSA